MNIVLTINLPGTAQGFTAVADLVRRFGDEACSVQVQDDVEEDVDEDMLLTILHGASQRMGNSPEARQLGELIHALQAPPAQRREELHHPQLVQDEAPPHGMPRPESVNFAKPNPTQKPYGNSENRKAALDIVVRNTSCPTCKAPRLKFCGSANPTPSTQSYGYQHVHQARINLLPWKQD